MANYDLNFLPPTREETIYLLANDAVYHKYDLALIWMQDSLLHFTSRYPKPRLSMEEANRKVEDLLLDEIIAPLSNHLRNNQAAVLAFSQQINLDAEIKVFFAERFLDTLEIWQGLLSDALITKDASHIASFLQNFAEKPTAISVVATVLLERAERLLESGDLQGSANAYKQIIDLEPNSAAAYVNYAQMLNALHEPQTALDYVNRAIQLEPDDVYAYLCRVELQTQLGNLSAARADYDRVLSIANAAGNWTSKTSPDSTGDKLAGWGIPSNNNFYIQPDGWELPDNSNIDKLPKGLAGLLPTLGGLTGFLGMSGVAALGAAGAGGLIFNNAETIIEQIDSLTKTIDQLSEPTFENLYKSSIRWNLRDLLDQRQVLLSRLSQMKPEAYDSIVERLGLDR
jgi:tetratricopeptide (TPR) repeat protein